MKLSKLTATLFGAAAAVAISGAANAADQGITDDEIVLGTHQPLSGPVAVWGIPVTNGSNMAIEEINAAGGVHGRNLRLVVEDSAYDPKKAVLGTQKMISRDKIFALVSTLGTPTSAATLPIAVKAQVPQLFPYTGGNTFWDPVQKYSFQSFTPYTDQSRAGVKYLVEQKGFKRVCTLYQDDEFGQTVHDGAEIQAGEMDGVEFVEKTTFKRGATDFSAQISRMKSEDCDLVVLGTIVSETIGSIGEAKKIGWDVQFMTVSSSFIPQLPPAALKNGVDMTGTYSVGLSPIYYPDTAPPEIKAWMDAYEAKFGEVPGLPAMGGYDHIMLIRHVAEKVGRDLTTDKFIAELENLKDYQPQFLSYTISFSPESHLGSRNSIMAIVNGERWETVEDIISY